jgi:hypothetical protein
MMMMIIMLMIIGHTGPTMRQRSAMAMAHVWLTSLSPSR